MVDGALKERGTWTASGKDFSTETRGPKKRMSTSAETALRIFSFEDTISQCDSTGGRLDDDHTENRTLLA